MSSTIEYREVTSSILSVREVGVFSVSSITMRSAVNSPMTIDVTCFPKADGTSTIPVATDAETMLNAYMEKALTLLLVTQNNKEPNTAVILEQRKPTGESQKIQFQGFLTSVGPAISMQGQAGIRFTASSRLFQLSVVDTSIYAACLPSTVYATEAINPLESVTSLAEAVEKVLDAWNRGILPSTNRPEISESEKATTLAKHAANAPGLAYARQILQANRTNLKLPFIASILDTDKTEVLGQTIHSILTGSGDMLNGLLGSGGLTYHFGLVFSCPFSAPDTVVMRPMDYVAGKLDAPGVITTSHTNYTPTVGGPGFVPLRGVRMALGGIASSLDDVAASGTREVPRVEYLTYPRNAATAGVPRVITVAPPRWVRTGMLRAALAMVLPSNQPPAAASSVPRVGSVDAVAAKAAAAAKEEGKRQLAILEDWLRMHYEFGALDTSSENTSFPLNLKIADPGKVMTVTGGGGGTGKPLFTGFVAAVTHTVTVAEEASVARTDISFSHVRSPGFVLP